MNTRDLGNELKIEPLSDRGWERVRQGVFAELELGAQHPAGQERGAGRTRWRLGLAAAALAGAGVVALGLVLSPGEDTGSVALPTSRIVTGKGATRTTVGDSLLQVAPASALRVIGDEERGWLVVLERGRVTCSVAPRKGRAPFAVEAGDARVEVVGTRFAVARERGSARVEVFEGTVKVTARGKVALVRAKQIWPPARRPEAVDESRRAEGDIPDKSAYESKDVGRVGATPLPETSASMQSDEETRPRSDTGRGPAGRTLSAGERFNKASELESSDPEAAVVIYRSLARGKGPWAANALYAQGRIELDRGRKTKAREALRRYLRSYPQGANAADARELLNRIAE